MKRLTRIIFVFVLLIFSMTCFISAASVNTERYDVSIDVKDDNSWVVTETIEMNFNDYRHGIFRYIPYLGKIYFEHEGEAVEHPYKVKISDVQVDEHEYTVGYENDSIVIRIGEEDKYVIGPITYTITYKVTAYNDRIDAFDQFYWGMLPTDWETPIENAKLTVKMPKKFDHDKAEFITGVYGGTDTDSVEWAISENVLSGELKRPLVTGEGTTLRIVLPEGYFTGVASNDWMLAIILMLIMLPTIFVVLLWLLFGRDPKVVKVVEFYPPEDINPSEIGYIIDGIVDSKDIVSIIVYFANKGYLSIREDKKKSFTLIKEKDLLAESKNYEQTIFNGLFHRGDEVKVKDLSGSFYDDFTEAKKQLRKQFTKNRKKRVFTQKSVGSRAIATLFMIIPLMSTVLIGTSYSYRPLHMAIPASVFIVGIFICYLVLVNIYDRRDSLKRKVRRTGIIVAGVILGLCHIAILLYCAFLENLIGLAILATIASLISWLVTMFMKKRTKESAKLLGRILGFKEFIRTAELDKIERLVNEEPEYFYNILPYAYVFGLTDKWLKRLEDIAVPIPNWYQNSYYGGQLNTVLFLSSFNHFTSTMQKNIVIPSSTGSKGFGGGFTGGGGFSGGGMGGGGGGSW